MSVHTLGAQRGSCALAAVRAILGVLRGTLGARGLILLVLAFVAGCSASADVVEVPVQGPGALIVVSIPRDSSTAPTVFAMNVDVTGLAGIPRTTLPDGELFALHYPCDLEALELAPGLVALAATPDEGRALPRPDAVAQSTATGWQTSDELPGVLAGLALAHPPVDTSPCTTFRTKSLAIPSTEGDYIDLAVELDDDTVLLSTRSAVFFRLTRDSVVELPQMVGLPEDAAFRDHDGRVWLLDSSGPTFVGHPDTGFVRGPSLAAPGTCVRAAVSPEGQPFEAFVGTCDGVIQHFDGTTWTLLAEGGPMSGAPPSLAWVAPGDVLTAGLHPPAVVRYAQGERVPEAVPLSNRDSASLAVVNPTLGPLIGTDVGALFRKTEDGWVTLGALSSLQRIRVALPLDGGTLFGGGGGELVQYYDGYGLCPAEELVAGHVWASAVLGKTLVVIVVGVRGSVAVFLDAEPVVQKTWPEACPAE